MNSLENDLSRAKVALFSRIEEAQNSAVDFLIRLIDIPSLSGQEQAAAEFIEDAFLRLGCTVTRLPISDTIKNHPLYCPAGDEISYEGRYNLQIELNANQGYGLVLNTHMDTVPPGENPAYARAEEDRIWGRGACDAKGQIAAIYLLFSALRRGGFELKEPLTAHIVVEEEIGGNGSLAIPIQENAYRSALVLEPTSLNIATAARGAVWFTLTVHGQAGHSGDAGGTKNAVLQSIKAIGLLQRYHEQLLEKLKGAPPFEVYSNPMPLTIGSLHGGGWPATVPDTATVKGVLGFLPGMTAETVKQEIVNLFNAPKADLSIGIEFPFSRDPFVTPRSDKAVTQMAAAFEAAGIAAQYDAFPACCDGWFYAHKGIPTIILGAGSLSNAHSNDEHVPIGHIRQLAKIIGSLYLEGESEYENQPSDFEQ